MARGVIQRQGRDGGDGWLAVFFEFWVYVLRHPELVRASPISTAA